MTKQAENNVRLAAKSSEDVQLSLCLYPSTLCDALGRQYKAALLPIPGPTEPTAACCSRTMGMENPQSFFQSTTMEVCLPFPAPSNIQAADPTRCGRIALMHTVSSPILPIAMLSLLIWGSISLCAIPLIWEHSHYTVRPPYPLRCHLVLDHTVSFFIHPATT